MSQLVLFLGVGKMGLPMARHLHTAGHSVQVHDLDADRLNMAQQAGLPLAGDVQAKVQQADVIISSLPHDAALLGVAEWLSQVGRAGQVLCAIFQTRASSPSPTHRRLPKPHHVL